MRKTVLEMSSVVDILARRKQKLLERKRRIDLKGKGVLAEEPAKEDSFDTVAVSNVLGRKRAREEDVQQASHDIFVDEKVQMSFPLEGSFFSKPKELLDEARKFLLPEDEKRYISLGHKKAAERNLLHAFQTLQGVIYMEKELVALSKKNKEVVAASNILKKDLEEIKSENDGLVRERIQLEQRLGRLELEKATEVKSFKVQIDKLKADFARL